MDQRFTVNPWLAWFMWSLTCCFYFFEFFLQVSPSVMVPQLMRDFSVSAKSIGSLSAFYFYIYALMQIPAGILLDRFGARKLLSSATVICALGSICFAQAHTFWIACLGRTLIGFGAAFAAIGSMSVAASWHPSKRFALLTGSLIGFGMLGAIFGESFLAIFVNDYGWRASMNTLGYIGLFIAATLWFFIKQRPDAEHLDGLSIREQLTDLLFGLKAVISNSQISLVALYGCFYFATTSAFGALWGTPFLMTAYHLSNTQAGSIVSFMFAGWALGSPLAGVISDRLQRRRPLLICTGLLGTIIMTTIIYVPLSISLLSATLFLFGFCSGGMGLIFAIGKENATTETVATAMGFINCLNMVGGAVLQPGIGALLDHFWHGQMHGGIRVYSTNHFHLALSLLPITLCISWLISFLIKETHCQSVSNGDCCDKKQTVVAQRGKLERTMHSNPA